MKFLLWAYFPPTSIHIAQHSCKSYYTFVNELYFTGIRLLLVLKGLWRRDVGNSHCWKHRKVKSSLQIKGNDHLSWIYDLFYDRHSWGYTYKKIKVQHNMLWTCFLANDVVEECLSYRMAHCSLIHVFDFNLVVSEVDEHGIWMTENGIHNPI